MKFRKIRSSVKCKSNDEKLGQFKNVFKCADACKKKKGCRYFVYGQDGKRTETFCYWEKTTPKCPKGFEKDDYDFYEVAKGKESPWM